MPKFKRFINSLLKTVKKKYTQTDVMCRPVSLLTSNISFSVHIPLVSRRPE